MILHVCREKCLRSVAVEDPLSPSPSRYWMERSWKQGSDSSTDAALETLEEQTGTLVIRRYTCCHVYFLKSQKGHLVTSYANIWSINKSQFPFQLLAAWEAVGGYLSESPQPCYLGWKRVLDILMPTIPSSDRTLASNLCKFNTLTVNKPLNQ